MVSNDHNMYHVLTRLIKLVVVDGMCLSVFNSKLSAWSVELEICATESGEFPFKPLCCHPLKEGPVGAGSN